MRIRLAIAAMAAVLSVGLAGCAEMQALMKRPAGGPGAPSKGGVANPVDLGDYKKDSPKAVLTDFTKQMNKRFPQGGSIKAAAADLTDNKFTCGKPGPGRGEAPAQVCRREVKTDDCVHTWQAHFYDTKDDGKIARVRSLYDRRCGGDDLLGG